MPKQEEPKQIRDCRKQVAKILARPHLFVNAESLDSPYRRFCFSSEDGSMAEAGNRVYSVVPFYKTESVNYWIGISVDAMIDHNIDLYGVSLIVFEGEASDRLKTPAFRAEWDYTNPNQNDKRHAQPHWHVYSVIDKSSDYMGSGFESEPRVKQFKAKSSDEIKRFHFAMGSQWHVEKTSHTCQLDFSNISNWLDGCINYIRGQFDYLYLS